MVCLLCANLLYAGAADINPALQATQLQQPAAVVPVDQGVAATASSLAAAPQLPDAATQTAEQPVASVGVAGEAVTSALVNTTTLPASGNRRRTENRARGGMPTVGVAAVARKCWALCYMLGASQMTQWVVQ